MEKSIADLTRRQDNLMDEREANNIDDGVEMGRAWAEWLRARFADLETSDELNRPSGPLAHLRGLGRCRR